MKARYLFVGALLLAIVAILGMRANHLKTQSLKSAIQISDQAGSNVEDQLEELQNFVFAHMNSSVRLELTASYERAIAAAQQAAVGGEIYAKAQATCDKRGVSSVAQAQCVQAYLADRLNNLDPAKLPNKSQYTYAFAAPTWSPDLAGLSLLGAMGLLFAAGTRYLVGIFKARTN